MQTGYWLDWIEKERGFTTCLQPLESVTWDMIRAVFNLPDYSDPKSEWKVTENQKTWLASLVNDLDWENFDYEIGYGEETGPDDWEKEQLGIQIDLDRYDYEVEAVG